MAKKVAKSEVKRVPPVTLRGVKLFWKNFEGRKGRFNQEGNRNFHIQLDMDVAKEMEADGWNIRWEDPREEGDSPTAHIKVKVSFDNYPPRILMKIGDKITPLGQDSVGILDWSELMHVGVMLSPYQWDVNGKQGVNAYLKKLTVELDPDDLETAFLGGGGSPTDNDEDDEV